MSVVRATRRAAPCCFVHLESLASLLQKLKKNQRVIVICNIGGTLDTNVKYRREKKIFADPDRAFGRESRSLKAAYELLQVREQAGWVLQALPTTSTDILPPPPPRFVCLDVWAPGRNPELPTLRGLQAGWSAGNIMHVEGGMSEWRFNGLPMDDGA